MDSHLTSKIYPKPSPKATSLDAVHTELDSPEFISRRQSSARKNLLEALDSSSDSDHHPDDTKVKDFDTKTLEKTERNNIALGFLIISALVVVATVAVLTGVLLFTHAIGLAVFNTLGLTMALTTMITVCHGVVGCCCIAGALCALGLGVGLLSRRRLYSRQKLSIGSSTQQGEEDYSLLTFYSDYSDHEDDESRSSKILGTGYSDYENDESRSSKILETGSSVSSQQVSAAQKTYATSNNDDSYASDDDIYFEFRS